ncbi:hypothetical protein [Butyrivibrio sp. MC2013]|uniref:hypothetical protein n=1 Tax=Butyrivibrio sp. MC2013 TaxID=1280686 RepID=UPI00040E6595|nr:hypothetical protein [Butyrivibrio sp. MC2013]
MKKISSRKWVISLISILLAVLLLTGFISYAIDPFFHYHAPLPGLYYRLDNERYQNDGITRHFEYDSLITGTSMTQNFKASLAEELWGGDFIKVCYSGAMYREIGDNVELALGTHDIKTVIRGIDGNYLRLPKDSDRQDLGTYPDYLYDDNIFNDVNYLLNGTVIAGYALPMIIKSLMGARGGVTGFDEYSNWMEGAARGREAVLAGREHFDEPAELPHLTDEDIRNITETVEQNITAAAGKYPDTRFIYFFPPYSCVWWGGEYEAGDLIKDIESYKLAAYLILQYDNIELYAFDDRTDITGDLDNYRDSLHYLDHINDRLMGMMAEGEGRLTKENVDSYYDDLESYYQGYDFNGIIN